MFVKAKSMEKKDVKIGANKRTNYEPMAVAKNIRPLVRNILGKNGIMQLEILSRWEEIAGADLAVYSFPEKIDFRANQRSGGIVHLLVPSGAFALELQHREQQILAKINAYFGYGAVSSLRIRQDSEIDFNKLRRAPRQEKEDLRLVSAAEKNYIQEMSRDVQDTKLKEILIKLGYSVFQKINKKENQEQGEVKK